MSAELRRPNFEGRFDGNEANSETSEKRKKARESEESGEEDAAVESHAAPKQHSVEEGLPAGPAARPGD
jgi:hypothetical protein